MGYMTSRFLTPRAYDEMGTISDSIQTLESPLSSILDQDRIITECLYVLLLQTRIELGEGAKRQGGGVWQPSDHSKLRV